MNETVMRARRMSAPLRRAVDFLTKRLSNPPASLENCAPLALPAQRRFFSALEVSVASEAAPL
jgi:hypothetical protein